MRNWMKTTRLSLVALAVMMSCTWMVGAVELIGVEHQLLQPTAVTLGEDGSLYLVDAGNNNVVQLEDDSATVVAGFTLPVDRYAFPAGGYNDGDVENSLFNNPSDLIFWNDGLVVSDTDNHVLRFIADGQVTTLAGSTTAGDKDGSSTAARFYLPTGLATDDDGNLYVADSGNGKIRKITVSGTVSTYMDGFVVPYGLDWYDGALYVSDLEGHQIFKVENNTKTLVAGANSVEDGVYIGGYSDGAVALAQFNGPKGIFVNETGIFVADSGNNALRLVAGGQVSTVFAIGTSGETWPVMPSDVAVYNRTVYLCDPFSGNLITLEEVGYLDIPADGWYTEGAYTMIDMGLMNGTAPQTFSPYQQVTREMAATVLYRLAGEPEITEATLFDDVTTESWCQTAIAWTVESQVMEGYSDTVFGLGQALTRQDFATMLYRYSQNCDMDTTSTGDLEGFQDNGAVAEYAAEAMAWAAESELIKGMDTTTLAPENLITRAELSVILTRWLDWMD